MRSLITHLLVVIGVIAGLYAGQVSARQAPVLEVNPQLDQTPVGQALELLEDPNGNLTYGEVLSRQDIMGFEAVDMEVPNMGYTESAIWLRFALLNTGDIPFDGVLEVAYAPLDDIQFYDGVKGSLIPKQAGDSLPFYNRDIKYYRAAFFLELAPGEQRYFYLRVKTSSSMQIPLLLWSQKSFVANASTSLLFWGLYFGALLVAAGYNLFMFLTLKDKVYGLYVLFVITVGLFQACVQGFASQYLWPGLPQLSNPVLLIALNAMGVAAAPFSIVFLRLRDFLPSAEKLLLGIIAVMTFNILLGWLLPYSWVIKQSILLFAFGSLLLIFSGAFCWKRGYKPARIYLISWVIMLLGAFIFSLKTIGLIESTAFTNYAVTVGSALEIFLLSLAIADRVSVERAQRRRAQQQNLDMQRELLDANRLALENAQASDKMKQDFLATMSHELRTPLNGILGCAQILDQSSLPADEQSTMKYLKSSANQMLGQVNRLLNFSQLHAGQLNLETTVFRLRDLLKDIELFFAPQCGERGLEFALQGPDEDVQIIADRAKMLLVVGDLLDNAIKFTSHGSVSLIVDLEEGDNHKDASLRFSVTDTGQGIDAEYQKSLFSMFSQQDGSYRRTHEGMGIGLAICDKYTALMGGSISFQSQVGKGSTFEVAFPVSIDRQDTNTQNPTVATIALSGTRILIVEDNPTNQMIIRKMLEKAGCLCEVAVNGEEALEKIRSQAPFAMVLMDCHMPVMDGFAATRAIRQLPDDNARVPIVAVTANAAAGDRERCLDSGMDDYLAKPFTRDELLSIIQARLQA